jgi:predicted transposase YbfD/YdcC
MQSTPEATELAGGLDLQTLLERLATIPDERCPKGVRYSLAPLLVLIVLAKLAGEDRPSGIAEWVAHRGEQLRAALQVGWRRMPHHTTYRRILAEEVSPEALDRAIGAYLQTLPGVGRTVLIAIDGKTVRGTRTADHAPGTHLLTAYLPEEGVVLAQRRVASKENEIVAAPDLLADLPLAGKVVAGDAMHTQRQLSAQILAADGDYLWVAKDNQPTLRADIELVFTGDRRTVMGGGVPSDFQMARTVEKGHGRRETRTLTVSSELAGRSAWPGLAQVFRLERERVGTASGKTQREVVYGLTSLPRAAASPARLLALTRAYWGIENGLHYRRDVTFHEDATRQTQANAGQVMASLNNLVISLLRWTGRTNLAAARRWWAAHLPQLLLPTHACSVT